MSSRAEILAHNSGIRFAITVASALADDVRTMLPEDPEGYRVAIMALEAVAETLAMLMLPVPLEKLIMDLADEDPS